MEDLKIFIRIFENDFLQINLKKNYPDRILQKLYALCRSEKFALKCLKLFQIEKEKLCSATWESFASSQLLLHILIIINNDKAIELITLNTSLTEHEPIYIKDGMELKTIYLEDNIITLKINLEMPKGQIIKKIGELITLLKEPKGRGKSEDFEFPFQVWDMHNSGKNYWQITQELFPHVREQNHITDDEAKAVYEEVQRAYKKADNLIKEIDKKFPD